ncbi:MAG: hypothetical protein HYV09_24330 [Deltaproteobacteria bacterium]|nr:hypothetical protein [Deltaproteobacteria bacterium]
MSGRLVALLAGRRATVAIVAAGLFVRVVVLALLTHTPLADDAADYHEAARLLASGAPHEPEWPPALPLLLAAFHAVLGASELVSRVAVLTLVVPFALVLVSLARRLGRPLAGNLALAAFAFTPSFVLLSVTPLTQLPTATLLLVTLWLALSLAEAPRAASRGARRSAWTGAPHAAALGGALGALVLVRPSNALLALVVVAFALLRVRRPVTLLAPLVLVLVVGAWELRATSLAGRFVFVNTANARNLYYGNNPWTPLYRTWWFGSHKAGEPGVPAGFVLDHARIGALPPAERDPAFTAAAAAHVRARPDLFAVRTFARARTFFAFDTFTGAQLVRKRGAKLAGVAVLGADAVSWIAIAGLALLGLCAAPRDDGERALRRVAGALTLLYALPYFVSFAHPTYHFPIAPLLGLIGAVALARRLEEGGFAVDPRRRKLLVVAGLALLLVQAEWIVHMAERV